MYTTQTVCTLVTIDIDTNNSTLAKYKTKQIQTNKTMYK